MFCNSIPVFRQAQDVACVKQKGHEDGGCLMYPMDEAQRHSRETLWKEFHRLRYDLSTSADEAYDCLPPDVEDESDADPEEVCQYLADVEEAVERAHGEAKALLTVTRALLRDWNQPEGA